MLIEMCRTKKIKPKPSMIYINVIFAENSSKLFDVTGKKELIKPDAIKTMKENEKNNKITIEEVTVPINDKNDMKLDDANPTFENISMKQENELRIPKREVNCTLSDENNMIQVWHENKDYNANDTDIASASTKPTIPKKSGNKLCDFFSKKRNKQKDNALTPKPSKENVRLNNIENTNSNWVQKLQSKLQSRSKRGIMGIKDVTVVKKSKMITNPDYTGPIETWLVKNDRKAYIEDAKKFSRKIDDEIHRTRKDLYINDSKETEDTIEKKLSDEVIFDVINYDSLTSKEIENRDDRASAKNEKEKNSNKYDIIYVNIIDDADVRNVQKQIYGAELSAESEISEESSKKLTRAIFNICNNKLEHTTTSTSDSNLNGLKYKVVSSVLLNEIYNVSENCGNIYSDIYGEFTDTTDSTKPEYRNILKRIKDWITDKINKDQICHLGKYSSNICKKRQKRAHKNGSTEVQVNNKNKIIKNKDIVKVDKRNTVHDKPVSQNLTDNDTLLNTISSYYFKSNNKTSKKPKGKESDKCSCENKLSVMLICKNCKLPTNNETNSSLEIRGNKKTDKIDCVKVKKAKSSSSVDKNKSLKKSSSCCEKKCSKSNSSVKKQKNKESKSKKKSCNQTCNQKCNEKQKKSKDKKQKKTKSSTCCAKCGNKFTKSSSSVNTKKNNKTQKSYTSCCPNCRPCTTDSSLNVNKNTSKTSLSNNQNKTNKTELKITLSKLACIPCNEENFTKYGLVCPKCFTDCTNEILPKFSSSVAKKKGTNSPKKQMNTKSSSSLTPSLVCPNCGHCIQTPGKEKATKSNDNKKKVPPCKSKSDENSEKLTPKTNSTNDQQKVQPKKGNSDTQSAKSKIDEDSNKLNDKYLVILLRRKCCCHHISQSGKLMADNKHNQNIVKVDLPESLNSLCEGCEVYHKKGDNHQNKGSDTQNKGTDTQKINKKHNFNNNKIVQVSMKYDNKDDQYHDKVLTDNQSNLLEVEFKINPKNGKLVRGKDPKSKTDIHLKLIIKNNSNIESDERLNEDKFTEAISQKLHIVSPMTQNEYSENSAIVSHKSTPAHICKICKAVTTCSTCRKTSKYVSSEMDDTTKTNKNANLHKKETNVNKANFQIEISQYKNKTVIDNEDLKKNTNEPTIVNGNPKTNTTNSKAKEAGNSDYSYNRDVKKASGLYYDDMNQEMELLNVILNGVNENIGTKSNSNNLTKSNDVTDKETLHTNRPLALNLTEILECKETKKAVLKLYMKPTKSKKHLIAKLPKVYNFDDYSSSPEY